MAEYQIAGNLTIPSPAYRHIKYTLYLYCIKLYQICIVSKYISNISQISNISTRGVIAMAEYIYKIYKKPEQVILILKNGHW